MSFHENIPSILTRLPRKPGIYQFFSESGDVIYIGKAKQLKNRVSSYFNKSRSNSGKTRVLAKQVVDIKVIVVESEYDALLLENNLIKEHQPRYNIQLKDDKSFPSIVIKNERFPRIFPTRQLKKDGSQYFGPYASVKNMNAVLDLIKKLYPIRTCSYNLSEKNIEAGKFKVCLEYHLGNCLGPCEGKQSEDEYTANVQAIKNILRGNLAPLIRDLKMDMKRASEELDYETAAIKKKQLGALVQFQARSAIFNNNIRNVVVFSIVSDANAGYVNFMRVNDGAIVNGRTYELKKRFEESDEELLKFAVMQFKSAENDTPSSYYLPFEIEIDLPDTKVFVPQKGDKKKLVELSERNARFYMRDKQKQAEQVDPEAHQKRILSTLQSDLHLKDYPIHIECFDNSNIQGTNPTSACVVFKNAKPSKDDYRKFNIKTVDGPNDFASMEEAVYRRYRRLKDEGEEMPQLVIIDGGKGQLSSAMKALDALELRGKFAVIGIAKRLEEIYFPGDSLPIYLDKRSESLKLIQQLRNEAHRFSLSHHRQRRSKDALGTELTSIKGVGMRSAQELLWNFKSVNKIKTATIKELEEVVNKRVARLVWEYYNG